LGYSPVKSDWVFEVHPTFRPISTSEWIQKVTWYQVGATAMAISTDRFQPPPPELVAT
jgi:hypothetical protein